MYLYYYFLIIYSTEALPVSEFQYDKSSECTVDPLGSGEIPGYLPGINEDAAIVCPATILASLL